MLWVKIGKHIVHNVMIDGESSMNVLAKNMRQQLGLDKPYTMEFTLRMANHSCMQPLGIPQNVSTSVWGFMTLITYGIIDLPLESPCPIILGHLWFRVGQTTHNGAKSTTELQHNDISKTISIKKHASIEITKNTHHFMHQIYTATLISKKWWTTHPPKYCTNYEISIDGCHSCQFKPQGPSSLQAIIIPFETTSRWLYLVNTIVNVWKSLGLDNFKKT